MLENIKKYFPKYRKYIPLVLLAAVGILLLFFGGGKDTAQNQTVSEINAGTDVMQYRERLEEEIEELAEKVRGVGSATAVVTLQGGFSSVYATEETTKGEEYVIIGSGSSAKALLLSQNSPTVAGVGIVCTGGNSASVRAELTALLSAAFHIPSNRIYITGAK